MAELTVRLTKAEQEFVERQMTAQGIGSASKYLSGLVKAERRRRAEEELAALIREGRESGFVPMTDEFFAGLRREIDQRERETQESKRGHRVAQQRREPRSV